MHFVQNYGGGFANINRDTGKPGPDATAPNSSQDYLCQVATRALIFIKARLTQLLVKGISLIIVAAYWAFCFDTIRVRVEWDEGAPSLVFVNFVAHCLLLFTRIYLGLAF